MPRLRFGSMTRRAMIPGVRLAVVALLIVVVGTVSATQSRSGLGSAQGAAASIDRVLAEAVARRDIPGVVAIATTRRGILYQGAFGSADLESGQSVELRCDLWIASMTKPVTSVAAMQQVEQGRFRLDDPAAKYFPELGNLKVIEAFDAQTGAYTVPVRHQDPDSSASSYSHIGSRIQLHQSCRSRLQAKERQSVFCWSAAFRTWCRVALWSEHRLGLGSTR